VVNVPDAEIRQRDGNRCARDGSTRDLHVHHRMLRSAGSDERACNRVTLCAACHRWVHGHPAEALEQGWLTGRYQDPAEIPVAHTLWPAGPVLLTDECAGIQIVVTE
jgi:hypothetical protein